MSDAFGLPNAVLGSLDVAFGTNIRSACLESMTPPRPSGGSDGAAGMLGSGCETFGVGVSIGAPAACIAFVDDGASFSYTVKLTFFAIFGPSGVYPGV